MASSLAAHRLEVRREPGEAVVFSVNYDMAFVADLTGLARLSQALARARAVPLAA
jgi:hypothetical protein